MEVVVYADILFALNFFMDLVMLFLTLLVTKKRISIPRLTASAFLLATYGTIAVLPNAEWLFSIMGRVGISLAALRCLGRKQWLKTTAVFWLITIALGGAMFALSMQTAAGRTMQAVMINGSFYLNVGMDVLLTGIAGVYALIWGFCRLTVRKFARERILIPFSLTLGGQTVKITALLDTGCELTVPATGDAMLLISRSSLGEISPKESFEIPIQTASGGDSICACYPEKMRCLDRGYEIVGIPAIGIVDTIFAEDGLYTAVLNPDMITENGGEKDEGKKGRFYQTLAMADRLDAEGKKGLLHRRKRKPSAAAQSGRGGSVASKTGPSPKPAGSTSNVN